MDAGVCVDSRTKYPVSGRPYVWAHIDRSEQRVCLIQGKAWLHLVKDDCGDSVPRLTKCASILKVQSTIVCSRGAALLSGQGNRQLSDTAEACGMWRSHDMQLMHICVMMLRVSSFVL